MTGPSHGVLDYDEHHHVDDGEHAQDGCVLQEVNSLGEAEWEDQEDGGGRDYEVPVEVPGVTEVRPHQAGEGSVELNTNTTVNTRGWCTIRPGRQLL